MKRPAYILKELQIVHDCKVGGANISQEFSVLNSAENKQRYDTVFATFSA